MSQQPRFSRHVGAALLTLSLLTPFVATRAQHMTSAPAKIGTPPGESRLIGGVSFDVGQPREQFNRYVNGAVGLGAHALYRLGDRGIFAVRLDGGFLNYGRETIRVPLSSTTGGRLKVDLTTTNDIAWLGVGPQLMRPRGAVRPYLNGIAGISYFSTTSSVEGTVGGNTPFARSTNHDDAQFSWATGTGVLVPVKSRARMQVFLDLGARFHDNGRKVRYLREGGIRELPNGEVQFDVIQSRADLLTYHVGVSIGAR